MFCRRFTVSLLPEALKNWFHRQPLKPLSKQQKTVFAYANEKWWSQQNKYFLRLFSHCTCSPTERQINNNLEWSRKNCRISSRWEMKRRETTRKHSSRHFDVFSNFSEWIWNNFKNLFSYFQLRWLGGIRNRFYFLLYSSWNHNISKIMEKGGESWSSVTFTKSSQSSLSNRICESFPHPHLNTNDDFFVRLETPHHRRDFRFHVGMSRFYQKSTHATHKLKRNTVLAEWKEIEEKIKIFDRVFLHVI